VEPVDARGQARFDADRMVRMKTTVTKKAKVLVVDDEPDAVELVEFNLGQAGCEGVEF
jgi:hypothetical protein